MNIRIKALAASLAVLLAAGSLTALASDEPGSGEALFEL